MTTSKMGIATAAAHPNIALVKYWGKRDEAQLLPFQSSLSLTLAPMEVKTTVEWQSRAPGVTLHGQPAKASESSRVLALLDVALKQTGHAASDIAAALANVRVTSVANFPMAAGLASSAAGFAALAIAARSSLGLGRDVVEESRLARLGSGSACRSIEGGFCAWRRGSAADGQDSYAESVAGPTHWPELRMLVAVVSGEEKAVKSRDGMRETVKTSPYYPAWVESAEAEIPRAERFIRERDLTSLGALAERNAWRMHATSLAADPPLCYLRPETLALILSLEKARAGGLPVWFTLDAGPNPVLLVESKHASEAEKLARAAGAKETILCHAGNDARLLDSHLS